MEIGKGIASLETNCWLTGCPISLNTAVETWFWLELKVPQNLVLCHVSIEVYRCLRRTRASAVRNCQLMPFWAALRASAHAVTCAWTASRGPARGQGLARQDAQFRFRPVEPAAVPGRKHQAYAPDPALGLGGRKGPAKRGVGMGVQVVADPDQALGLAVARVVDQGLDRVRPVHGRAPLAQRLREHPDRAGAAPHVCVVVGGRTARARRLRRPLVGPQRFGWLVPADHRIARIVGPAVTVQHRLHQRHERFLWHGRIAPRPPPPGRQFVFLSTRRTVS